MNSLILSRSDSKLDIEKDHLSTSKRNKDSKSGKMISNLNSNIFLKVGTRMVLFYLLNLNPNIKSMYTIHWHGFVNIEFIDMVSVY